MFSLMAIAGPSAGKALLLEEGEYPVGRSSRAALPLNDPAVSREQFSVRIEGTRAILLMAPGASPVRVNGAECRGGPLEPGSHIEIGNTTLRFDEAFIPSEEPGGCPIESSLDATISPFQELAPARSGSSERALKDRAILFDAAIQLPAQPSEEELFQRVIQLILQGVAADRAVIFSRSVETHRWTPRAMSIVSGGSGRYPAGSSRTTWSRTALREAARTRRAFIAHDARTDQRIADAPSVLSLDLDCILVAPLMEREEVVGAVYLDSSSEDRRFSSDDVTLVLALTQLTAVCRKLISKQESLRRASEVQSSRNRELSIITTQSPAMLESLDTLNRAAPTDATVLVRGESGTGKELAAAFVHFHSPRMGQPFIAVNCAALSPMLIESELFGHVRGAFTDAASDREGVFQQADGGTLFLDEIGDMPLDAQAKLLRVLETRLVTPVGGTRPRSLNIRIVCGTNRDLEVAVSNKTFREDLYYRLRVVEVVLPPLRDRVGDVALLAKHFLQLFNRTLGKQIESFTERALDALVSHSWPGNIRELKNSIESSMILTRGKVIDLHDLPAYLRTAVPAEDIPGPEQALPGPGVLSSLAEIEKLHIRRVMQHAGGNKMEASRILGIDRKTLYKKLGE